MSNYTKSTDFAAKDALITGSPSKIVKGTEIDAEFEALEVAVATKLEAADIGVSVQAYDVDLTSWAGITPSSKADVMAVSVVSGTTQTAVVNTHYVLTNVAATTVTLPATPTAGDMVFITWTNSLTTNVVARNGQTIMGDASDLTLDSVTNGTVQLRFVNSSWRLL